MATVLLFTLGTGKYLPTEYVFEGGEPCGTRFAAQALRRFHDERFSATPIDRAVVFVTPDAKKANWDDTPEHPGLETTWTHREPCPLIRRELANPEGEGEFWDLFEAIAREVQDGDRVVLDITHGFRTMPLVSTLAIAYLRAVRRDVEVVMVGYGQYVPNVSPTLYLDLAPFISLLDWTQAVQQLRAHGDASGLAGLLAARQREAYQASRAQGWDQPQLQRVAKALDSLALGIQTLRYENFVGASKMLLETLDKMGAADRKFARPFFEVADTIRAEVAPLAEESSDQLLTDMVRHWRTLEWLWARGLYFPWLSLLNEALIAHVAAVTGLDDLAGGDERCLREVHHFASIILAGARPDDSTGEEREVRPWSTRNGSAFSREVLAVQDQRVWRAQWRQSPHYEAVSALADKVSYLRNALMHAGFSVNEVAPDGKGIVAKLNEFRQAAVQLPIWVPLARPVVTR